MADSQEIEFFENLTNAIRDMQSVFPFGVGKATYLYFDKLLKQIHDPNKKIILANIAVCPEICYAMDLVPIQQELTTAFCAVIGTSVEHLDSAVEAGIPQGYLCNFQKVWIGAMISNKLPRPDILVYAPEPCDSMHANYQVIQNLYKIPAFGFDIPYWTHEESSPYYSDTISKYMGNQVKKMVSFLEKHTNSKLDPEKLKEAIEKSNIARQNILEILEFCKAVPSPLPSSVLTPFLLLLSCLLGSDEAIHLTKSVRDEVYSRFKNKQGHIALTYKKKTEKLRLLWLLIPIAFDLGISAWMERKYSCMVLMDILSIYLTPPIDMSSLESIYRDLGKAVLDYPMGRQYRGPIEYFLDDVLRICRDYKIDAAILGGHNCKNVFAVRKLIAETLIKEVGIKTLELEADSLDPRVNPRKNIKRTLGQFLDRVTEEKYGIEK
ncbi:MAG: 2-hydroxyacyl-CoA dehydratase [Candidatus Helarchaeota archaeon]|nr:2-hydroxyacyl-CoA dehydratase [Candidatus Helarchaeota archaeon]